MTCANIGFRELVLNPRDAPQTHVWGASLLSEPRRRGRWFSGGRLGAVPEWSPRKSPRKSPRDPRRRPGVVAEGIKLQHRLKWVTPLGWGLLGVVVATARSRAPRPEKQAWFSITSHYRKPEIRTNRASPRGAPRKRHRRAATDSEQSRRAEHQQHATPQTKHHSAVLILIE